jgi:hypothetical protein
VTFADALIRLETGLRSALPGPDAQARLAPLPRRQWPTGLNPARIRNAAGLLLVFPKPGNAKRAEHAKQDMSSSRVLRLCVPRLMRRTSS